MIPFYIFCEDLSIFLFSISTFICCTQWKRLKPFGFVDDCVYSEHISLNGTKFWVITRMAFRLTVVLLPQDKMDAVFLLNNKYGRK
jgi:hypothetical protein